MRILVILISLLALGALLLSTTAGQRLAKRLGFPPLRDRAPKDDRAFLLKVCDGDRGRLRERLDAERARSPNASDAELHRKAIRRVFQERES